MAYNRLIGVLIGAYPNIMSDCRDTPHCYVGGALPAGSDKMCDNVTWSVEEGVVLSDYQLLWACDGLHVLQAYIFYSRVLSNNYW